jgi:hypothetical protein
VIIRVFLGRGHTKETGNRNATAVSENCYQSELNTCYWMEQRKLRKLRYSFLGVSSPLLTGNITNTNFLRSKYKGILIISGRIVSQIIPSNTSWSIPPQLSRVLDRAVLNNSQINSSERSDTYCFAPNRKHEACSSIVPPPQPPNTFSHFVRHTESPLHLVDYRDCP